MRNTILSTEKPITLSAPMPAPEFCVDYKASNAAALIATSSQVLIIGNVLSSCSAQNSATNNKQEVTHQKT